MRSSKARPELDALVARLRSWEATVPERARRFHIVQRELATEIGAAFSFWKPWIADAVVQRYRDRVAGLSEVAEPLTELIRQTEILESEVQRLAERSAGPDAELASWFEARCRDWQATLSRLGANCYRHSDLHGESTLFANTETDVRLYDEALDQLREAERLLSTLGADLSTAELTARLPDLRRRLYAQAPLQDWLNEIKGLVKPLKGVSRRVQDPPAELSGVRPLLTEARGWSSRLGESRAEVERLEEHQFKAVEWNTSQVQTLMDQARALRDRLRERAAHVRGERLRELEEQMEDLQRACGRQPELAERLAALRRMTTERPQMYEDWTYKADLFHNSFKSIAHSHSGRLETGLREAEVQLEAMLAELESRPLSVEVTKEVALLRQELRQLPQATEIEHILRWLRRAAEMSREIDQLGQRAQQEFRDVEHSQNDLSVRAEILRAEVERIRGGGIEIADVTAKIAALSQSTEETSLESRRHQAGELRRELERLETQFAERCREKLSVKHRAVRRTSEALHRAGVPQAVIELPSIGPGASPRVAAEALLQAKQLHRSLMREAHARRKDLEDQRMNAQSEIAAVRPGDLAPGDSQECEQLIRELASGAWSRTSSLLEQVERLAKLIARCGSFTERLHREQRTALQRREELKQRLQAFYDDQLHTYCPELTQRVEGLIFGLPAVPRQWSAMHYQLGLAGELLARVDVQARRLAADEVHRDGETLRQRIRGASNASFRASAKALLAELDDLDPDALPPATLRLRLSHAAKGWA